MNKKSFFKSAFLAAGLILVLTGCSLSDKISSKTPKSLNPEQAKAKAEQFINDNLMAAGTKAKIDSVTLENGLYKLSVNVGQGTNIDSYMSKDGSKFYPQAIDTKKYAEEAAATNGKTGDSAPAAQAPKKDKVSVELFVMSYCPFGTQIEKGILPALEALGNKIDFKLKFCDYAMHGEKELAENLVQYCIQKDQPSKLNAYLKCFLEKGEGTTDSCMASAKVDAKKAKACVATTDKTFKVTENFKANKEFKGSYPGFDVSKEDNLKYNVGGSPTLIINGSEISAGRDANSLLQAICSGFNNAPEECKKALSSDTPSAGFGSGTTSNTNAAAGCATN